MMALAPAASVTCVGAVQIEKVIEANGHSWQPFPTVSLSDAMTPAMALLWSSAAGVPRESHPLRLQVLQVGSAKHRATHGKEQARTWVTFPPTKFAPSARTRSPRPNLQGLC
jgi:hypothetical protein